MSAPFRIAVVSPFLDRSHGTERCIVEQMERLVKTQRCEVHLYSHRIEDLPGVQLYSPKAVRAHAEGGIFWHKVSDVPGPHLLKYLWWFVANQVRRRLDIRWGKIRYDLVYTAGINCFDAGAIAVHIVFHEFHRLVRDDLRLKNLPWRSWPRALHRKLYYRLIMFLERRIYTNPRIRLAAVSRLTAQELAAHFGRNDVAVIPNAVDAARFHPAARAANRRGARARFSFADEDFVLLLVGNDWKKKGLAPLLDTMVQCRDLPLRLLVVGRDDQIPYRKRIAELGLGDRVQFAGPSSNVLSFYAAADAYVGPSLHDSFALPPAEAMACGLPVITSARNGGSQMITDGSDGFILQDPRDTAQLAALLRRLGTSPELCRTVGENAARTAARYTWERNARETRMFLESASRTEWGRRA